MIIDGYVNSVYVNYCRAEQQYCLFSLMNRSIYIISGLQNNQVQVYIKLYFPYVRYNVYIQGT